MLFIDIETSSLASVTKYSLIQHASHESTRVTVIAYAFNDNPVEVVSTASWDIEAVAHFVDSLVQQTGRELIVAHNAEYEAMLFKYCLGLDIKMSKYLCTMQL